MQYTMGTTVECTDGPCGDLRRIVVDPVARAVTHLVVEPRHHRTIDRLVPIDLVSSSTPQIQLTCARSEFAALDEAEQTQFLPGAHGDWGYPQEQLLSWPYYGVGLAGTPLGLSSVIDGPRVVTIDSVPIGDVEVRRGDHVHATDGDIGRVRGLVVGGPSHNVTHVLLDEGHLWGAKEVVIPMFSITRMDAGVRLNLTKDQVRDLPELVLDAAVGEER